MGKCRTTVRLPQGDAKLTLEVRDGAQHASSTTTAAVRTLLVVAMGDSYASGEGNPRNVQAWLRQGGSLDPYWDDNACHRSARGGPAAAALALEKADPHTSVSLVYVACSGATIANGILGPQAGVGASVGQVEQVRQVIGDRPVDYVFLSIGGNDVGFTSVLETCARTNDCPLARPAGSLSSFPTLQRGVQTTTAQLPQGYAHIAACLGGSGCTRTDGTSQPALTLAPGASVLPVLYPDITRDAAGAPCTYLTIGSNEFAWARDTILDPSPPNPYAFTTSSGAVVPLATDAGSLNGQLSATGSALGWRPAAGAWLASGTGATGHGVCAGEQAWAFGFTGLSALPSASFHPNPAGQRAIADALVAAARG
jgi:lysophospholipase L1-like esterase